MLEQMVSPLSPSLSLSHDFAQWEVKSESSVVKECEHEDNRDNGGDKRHR